MPPGTTRSAGQRVGPFEIVRYLASGGMGDVYVGRHATTGEPVALKFLADASPASRERFEREGRIAASLSHPHIVAGRGLGRADDGAVFIAMELLDGSDLEARQRAPGVAPAELLRIASQVCEALECAHARRIVHRDLKPQNIFLCDGDALTAKVLDFGVARLTDERKVTGTGTIIGSWSYMSPEQARAEPDIDARSDLWSLGVVLFEGLAGRLPFDAPTGPGTLYQILFEPAPDLAKLRPDLPRVLVDVVHRALAKPRDERFAGAQAMRAALAAIDPRTLPGARVAFGDDANVGFTDTLAASDSASQPGIPPASGEHADAANAEYRLTSVVFLRGLRDDVLLGDVARELQGRVVTLPGDDVLVVFGTDRWNGDEPDRAVRLAAAVSSWARGVGVATGRALRGASHVTGVAVDLAVALSRREGVHVDATTRTIVRGYAFEVRADGCARLDPRSMRARVELSDASSTALFVGRDVEVGALLQAARAAAEGQQPGGVVVVGAAGMGKTRLRHEALSELLRTEPATILLASRCEAFRRDTPFAALVDALGDVVDASVARVFSAVALGSGDPLAALDRARASLETVLRGLAARGLVVLAIDDVQWLDAASQSAVRWVLENAPDLPLAVWLFGRPEARDTAAATLPGASVLELKPLAKGAAEHLMRSLVGQAPDALIERAAGHPLFLEELGRLFLEHGAVPEGAALPPSVEGAHLAQLDQLEPGDREFLKRASVFGRSAWVEAVVALGGDAAGFERLKRANLLVARPRSRFDGAREFAFRNGVLQEVAYGLWTEVQRARLHERAATWLAAQPAVAADELARHWDLAGDRPRAAEAYTAAAEVSAHVSDTATTCAHAERAIELSEDASVRWRALVARDDALQLAGDRGVQQQGLTLLAESAALLGPGRQAEAAWRWCYFARMTSDRARAFVAGEQAIALADAAGTPRWAAAAHNELALMLANEGNIVAAADHAASARVIADVLGDEWSLGRAIGTEAYVQSEAGDDVRALELFELSAARYARAGDRRREALALANAGTIMVELGRVAEAQPRIEAAVEASRRVGNARTVAVSVHNLGVIKRLQGAPTDAEVLQRQAEAEALRLGHRMLALSAAIERAYLALEVGASDVELRARAESVTAQLGSTPSPQLAASAHAALARMLGRSGHDVAAHVAALRALLPSLTADASRADALAAAWEFGGRADADLADARAALTRRVGRLPSTEDGVGCRESFRRRIVGPDALTAP